MANGAERTMIPWAKWSPMKSDVPITEYNPLSFTRLSSMRILALPFESGVIVPILPASLTL